MKAAIMSPVVKPDYPTRTADREDELAFRVWGHLRIEYPEITREEVAERLHRDPQPDRVHAGIG
jgi:hypothetical protein